MKKFRLFLFVFILSLTACQEQMEEATSEFITAKDRLWMIKEIQGGVNTKAVADITKTWQSGDTIRIKFLNGTETLQNKVKQYASIWLEYADLVFEYVENDADVKISFDWEGKLVSWSTIGTDCRLVPQNESSLNFVYLDDPDEEFVRGEVLRAFGHVLGLGFEHKNPSSPLVFKANAAATLQDYYGLTEEEVIDFMAQYQTDQTNYTDYDKSSIMVAEIPGSILENRRLATTFNTELSENDIAFISQLYKPVEPKRTFEFEVLVDSIYPSNTFFFVDHLKENLYYLLPETFPVDIAGKASMIKMDLNTRVKAKMFGLEGIVGEYVVDKQENFYVGTVNQQYDGVWKYNRNGVKLQQMYSPWGSPLGYNNVVTIDGNDNLYSSVAKDMLISNEDTIYILRFNPGFASSVCIKEMVISRPTPAFTILNMKMIKEGMLFRTDWRHKDEFFQMDTPMGQTLSKKNLNVALDFDDDFGFITNRNSDIVYLVLSYIESNTADNITFVKNPLYRYNLNNGEMQFIGDLPLQYDKSDGTVLKDVCIVGGEVLNENELLLAGVGKQGNITSIIKVNIITANR